MKWFRLFILLSLFLLCSLLLQVRDRQGPVKLLEASAAWAAEKSPRAPDVHFVGTPHEVVEIMLRLADVKQTDIVYDLGCGDGRIVIAAAKKAGCRAYGFDLDPEMVEKSIRNVKKEKLEALVTIEQKDIFDLDLSRASVVTLYLLPELNVALIPQLEKMKPGSRIVSHNFDMEGIDPDVEATVHRKDGKSNKVYLWTTPLKQPRPHILRKLFFGK
jgi:SAM-dependent methyltransferase